jgi:hypothetical protein
VDYNRITWRVMSASNKAMRCQIQVGRGKWCLGKPRGRVTLCPIHLKTEFIKRAEKYRKAFETATAEREHVEALRREIEELDVPVMPTTPNEVLTLLSVTGELPSPPTLEPTTEDLMPPKPLRGRPPKEYDEPYVRRYVKRQQSRTATPSPHGVTFEGVMDSPEEQEEFRASLGMGHKKDWRDHFVIKPTEEEPSVKPDELMGGDTTSGGPTTGV